MRKKSRKDAARCRGKLIYLPNQIPPYEKRHIRTNAPFFITRLLSSFQKFLFTSFRQRNQFTVYFGATNSILAPICYSHEQQYAGTSVFPYTGVRRRFADYFALYRTKRGRRYSGTMRRSRPVLGSKTG